MQPIYDWFREFYERTGINLTEELGDKATADVLTEVVRQVDKDLWFLEAHLQA